MKISGFSFVRNGISLYYPIVEAVKSILPIVDEFVIAIGKSSEGDNTREQIAAINDPKIKIIDTVWEEKYFKRGIINSIQTDIAMKECTGDWLFYLQADEVVHEKYLNNIVKRCEELKDDDDVEGLLFRYKHFWGDYKHYHTGHGWYPNEIRIVKNKPEIHSWQSAQSFRKFEYYDNPRQEAGHSKLKVATVDAEVYHYGWVRPPHLMQNKKRALDSVHWGLNRAKDHYEKAPTEFDYGSLDLLGEFNDTHPEVMAEMISKFNWDEKLQLSGKPNKYREPHKHETMKYRFISFVEKYLNGGKNIGGFRNYILLDK
ncbi:MAG: glycosyltransferase [Melioribacteraceae bacterium]|nr:glycosyltransferase [Melioribacteraceae bacterium]